MSESPLTSSPYDVLGVSPTASDDDLRRAYRRMLRATHPDTGGDPVRFHAVQRAWERVGTPEARASWDGGRGGAREPGPTFAPAAPEPRRTSRPAARAYGHPGGQHRERYLAGMREWLGRGNTAPDLFDPQLVRSAPRELRHLLAAALAEEATAKSLAELGIGFTIWHDVDTGSGKLDHVVLGPTGLFAIQSEDWGGAVDVRRGELISEGIGPRERPMHSLGGLAKAVQRSARVRFTALLIVVPDADAPESLQVTGTVRGAVAAVVAQSRLAGVLREGLPGGVRIGGTELFEVRTRLQSTVRFH